MKLLLYISLLTFSLNCLSQNENKKYTFEELWATYTPYDTTIELTNYNNGNLKRKRVIFSAYNKQSRDIQLFFHKEEIYRKNGVIKKETFYKLGLFDRLFLYHKNGNKFAETTCEYDNENEHVSKYEHHYHVSIRMIIARIRLLCAMAPMPILASMRLLVMV